MKLTSIFPFLFMFAPLGLCECTKATRVLASPYEAMLQSGLTQLSQVRKGGGGGGWGWGEFITLPPFNIINFVDYSYLPCPDNLKGLMFLYPVRPQHSCTVQTKKVSCIRHCKEEGEGNFRFASEGCFSQSVITGIGIAKGGMHGKA